MAVSLSEYKKALEALRVALQFASAKTNDIEFKIARDACIQRFEFCIELAWKTSGRLLGSSSTASKVVIREMAQNGLIQDPTLWFDFIEARNQTSHSYDEDVAKSVFLTTQKFLPEGERLLKALESK